MEYSRFTIYEKASGDVLATLPTTFPIGDSVRAFERAGHVVGWTWA